MDKDFLPSPPGLDGVGPEVPQPSRDGERTQSQKSRGSSKFMRGEIIMG